MQHVWFLLGVKYLTCNSQKCVYIVEWMEPYTGKEMKQLSDSSRCGKGWSHQRPEVCSNQRWMSPFEQKHHADLVGKVAECKPCKWYLAATIKRTELVCNQPITHLWLQGPKPPALSNMLYYPSTLIKQEAHVLQVSADIFIQPVQGHWAAGLCDFDACGQSPPWHLVPPFNGH